MYYYRHIQQLFEKYTQKGNELPLKFLSLFIILFSITVVLEYGQWLTETTVRFIAITIE